MSELIDKLHTYRCMEKHFYPEDIVTTRDIWELLDEIERLNNDIKELLKENENKEKVIKTQDNIIKDIKSQLDYLETYSSKEDVFEDMKRRLDRIDKIIGSDK